MYNIKKIFIFSIFVFYGIECICSFKLIDKEAAKVLAPACIDASRGIGADAAIELAKSNVEIAKIAAEVGGPVILAATVVVGIGVTAYSVTELQPVVKDTYEFIYPTEEQKRITEDAARKLKHLKAEAKFVDCMINSKPDCEVNKFNRPTACEDAARMLALCGGNNKVIEVTNIFNEYK